MDFGYLLLLACAALVLCPPKYDPAIRIKVRQESAIQKKRRVTDRE